MTNVGASFNLKKLWRYTKLKILFIGKICFYVLRDGDHLCCYMIGVMMYDDRS